MLKVAENFPDWWNNEFGMFLDGFIPMVWMVYIRFGKWEEILSKDISKFKQNKDVPL